LVCASLWAHPAAAGDSDKPSKKGGAKDSRKSTPSGAPPKITFSDECAAGDRIVIAAVGDVLVHTALQKQAVRHKARFRSLWAHVAAPLAAADITYGNLEGPSAPGVTREGKVLKDPGLVFDDIVYTGYPRFNYHPSLLLDLAADGFDVVSTANNHGSDRGGQGVDLTIASVQAAGIVSAGTRLSTAAPNDPWHAITEANGIRVAWLACTKHINGMHDTGQVLPCYAAFGEDSTDTNPVVIQVIKDLAADPSIDAIIVTPHFGKSSHTKPNEGQVAFAHNVLDAGALAVIGSHVHNLQPWELYKTPDGREAFVMYSMGNFVSTMTGVGGHSTAILYLGLTRRASDKRVVIHGVRYLPLYMSSRDGAHGVEPISELGKRIRDEALPYVSAFIGPDNFIDLADITSPIPLTPACAR
jgi:poly-gamma-glutamate synthesis protein (capsule biosynthesis protein)